MKIEILFLIQNGFTFVNSRTPSAIVAPIHNQELEESNLIRDDDSYDSTQVTTSDQNKDTNETLVQITSTVVEADMNVEPINYNTSECEVLDRNTPTTFRSQPVMPVLPTRQQPTQSSADLEWD